MARGEGTVQPKGIVETTLGAVNPEDKDYGALVDDWRKEVFENTVQTVYLWGLISTTLGLGISMVLISWLLRQREQRLTVSADIVAQLYNAYVTSRSRTLEVIGKYNWLVEKYNRLDTEATEMRTKLVAFETEQGQAAANQADLNFDNVMKNRLPVPSPEHNKGGSAARVAQYNGVSKATATQENASATTEVELLRKELADRDLKIQRQSAQLRAKTEENTNLRCRLSKVHDTFQTTGSVLGD